MNMKGIDIVRDISGNIQEIRLSAQADPALIQDVLRLVKIRTRQNGSIPSAPQKPKRKVLSVKGLSQLISESKASGELTETDFFQLTPAWLKKRNELSSPSFPTPR